MTPRFIALVVVCLAPGACKDSGSAATDANPAAHDILTNQGGDTAPADGAPADAPVAMDTARLETSAEVAGMACGAGVCQADEICVNPCCGGPAPPCVPRPEAGTCPAGAGPCIMIPGNALGCEMPCTPPPPFCQPASKPLPPGCMIERERLAICRCA